MLIIKQKPIPRQWRKRLPKGWEHLPRLQMLSVSLMLYLSQFHVLNRTKIEACLCDCVLLRSHQVHVGRMKEASHSFSLFGLAWWKPFAAGECWFPAVGQLESCQLCRELLRAHKISVLCGKCSLKLLEYLISPCTEPVAVLWGKHLQPFTCTKETVNTDV